MFLYGMLTGIALTFFPIAVMGTLYLKRKIRLPDYLELDQAGNLRQRNRAAKEDAR